MELGPLAPAPFSDRILAPLRAALTAPPGSREGEEAEAELGATLAALEQWLGEYEVDYIGGDGPDATDCYLAPKLMHAALALRSLRGRSLPGARGAPCWCCVLLVLLAAVAAAAPANCYFSRPKTWRPSSDLFALRPTRPVEEYPMVGRYLERWQARDSWRGAAFEPDLALDTWRRLVAEAQWEREG